MSRREHRSLSVCDNGDQKVAASGFDTIIVLAYAVAPVFALALVHFWKDMKTNPVYPIWSSFALDRTDQRPLQDQIVAYFREAISSGQMRSGSRLPPTRELATELGVARNTVVLAYERLIAEGYLDSRTGSGTFVTEGLFKAKSNGQGLTVRRPSTRGQRTLNAVTGFVASSTLPLTPGLPALDQFPFSLWARLSTRFWKSEQRDRLPYGDPAGYGPLRVALARYLRAARGIACEPEQVLIVSGSQAGIDTTARVLLDPGDQVWVEDPGYVSGRSALAANGARLVAVPVDEQGLDPQEGERLAPNAKLAVVSPSHQYPLGAIQSLPRRLAMLDWAERADAWILEDDYDGEFRYAGKPISALHSLDPDGRVLYLGTLSKVLAPSLRIGYLVVPADLIDAFVAARAVSDRHVPIENQAVVTDFIEGGHLAAHVRRLRPIYDSRRRALLEAFNQIHDLVEPIDYSAGLHFIARLRGEHVDAKASAEGLKNGVNAPALSSYGLARTDLNGFVIGFANTYERQAKESVAKLREAIIRSR
ncbi:GntR family transcriptional regulator/MocR family aminotransferase [Rhizobium pisi]